MRCREEDAAAAAAAVEEDATSCVCFFPSPTSVFSSSLSECCEVLARTLVVCEFLSKSRHRNISALAIEAQMSRSREHASEGSRDWGRGDWRLRFRRSFSAPLGACVLPFLCSLSWHLFRFD